MVNIKRKGNRNGGTGSHNHKLLTTRERQQYKAKYESPYCDIIDKYQKVLKIGHGTYGEVFKARVRRKPEKIVAIKKVLMENEHQGFPITALREIKILKALNHENIVNLIEVCYTRASKQNSYISSFYLVFDFYEHDLAGLLSNADVQFNLGEIKRVIQQLLNALYYVHNNKMLHRDVKPANVLITKKGVLKLADFGLSKAFSANKNGETNRLTNLVCTLWYRPPELLLGERNYGPPVDLWSVGCIMAEMWTRAPILQGTSEQHQLTLISELCGSITPQVWPDVNNLTLYKILNLPPNIQRKVKERLTPLFKDVHACDLVDKLLVLDPSKRADCGFALSHDFFWSEPMPCDLGEMLAKYHQSMFSFLA